MKMNAAIIKDKQRDKVYSKFIHFKNLSPEFPSLKNQAGWFLY